MKAFLKVKGAPTLYRQGVLNKVLSEVGPEPILLFFTIASLC